MRMRMRTYLKYGYERDNVQEVEIEKEVGTTTVTATSDLDREILGETTTTLRSTLASLLVDKSVASTSTTKQNQKQQIQHIGEGGCQKQRIKLK